jgi:hypothetical protein
MLWVPSFKCESSFIVRRKCGSFLEVRLLIGQSNVRPVRATLHQTQSRVDLYVVQIDLPQTWHCFQLLEYACFEVLRQTPERHRLESGGGTQSWKQLRESEVHNESPQRINGFDLSQPLHGE